MSLVAAKVVVAVLKLLALPLLLTLTLNAESRHRDFPGWLMWLWGQALGLTGGLLVLLYLSAVAWLVLKVAGL